MADYDINTALIPALQREAPDPVEKGINAWVKARSVGIKEQALQNAKDKAEMQAALGEQRLQNQSVMDQLAYEKMQRNDDFRYQQLFVTANRDAQNDQNRVAALQLQAIKIGNDATLSELQKNIEIAKLERLRDNDQEKIKTKAKQDDDFAQAITIPGHVQQANPDLLPGSDQLMHKAVDEMAPYLKDQPASIKNAIMNKLYTDHNNERNAAFREQQITEQGLKHDIARSLQAGDDLNINYDPILNWEKLPNATTITGPIWNRKVTVDRSQKQMTIVDPTTKQQVPRNVSIAELQDFKKRILDMRKRRDQIGHLVDMPDIGVNASQPWPGKEYVVPGNRYNMPDGSGKSGYWDGTKWSDVR